MSAQRVSVEPVAGPHPLAEGVITVPEPATVYTPSPQRRASAASASAAAGPLSARSERKQPVGVMEINVEFDHENLRDDAALDHFLQRCVRCRGGLGHASC
jgi:hypothetical protein